MATVREVVLPRTQKKDGTWNVKIRVSFKRRSSYIDTQHYIGQKQLRKDFTIKDEFILTILNPVVDSFRKRISELGESLELYTSKSLVAYLTMCEETAETINIIAFGEEQIRLLDQQNRTGSRNDMKKVVNSLRDYFKAEFIPITEIRSKMLENYERYLRSERTMFRPDQFGNLVERRSKGLTDVGLHNHMRDLRILFNAAVKKFNDPELGVTLIKHYPFEKYKIVSPPDTNKRKLSIEDIERISKIELPANSRAEMARDLFMLSFYLCGMNPVDLYRLPEEMDIEEGRLEYNRSKTKDRRKDKAFMSLRIPDVAKPLLIKYIRTLKTRYASHENLDSALSFGMRKIGAALEIKKLQFYDARHAFADLARNKCGFQKDDVAMALNHKDSSNSVTDVYLSKDWAIVDRLQKSVLSLFDPPAKLGFCNLTTFYISSKSYTS